VKRAIYTLFAVAALSAALQPAYAAQRSWILVAILFDGTTVLNSRMFGDIPSEAECKSLKASIDAEATAAKVDLWTGCIEMVRVQGDPKTKQNS
jgi:hypothetical protein